VCCGAVVGAVWWEQGRLNLPYPPRPPGVCQNAGVARACVGMGDAASVQDRPTVQRGRGARPALRQEGGARRAQTASIKFDGPGIGTLKFEGHMMFTVVSLRTKGADPQF
jgi:hypothetical protein